MSSDTPNTSPADPSEAFAHIRNRLHAAGQQFVNGDPTPIKALWSQADDVSIFGAGGGYGRGWEQVGPSLDGGASQFHEGHEGHEGHIDMDIIAQGTSGDLAYTVWIEHGAAIMRGGEGLRPLRLRVTQLYHWEGGTWKVIHRHADTLLERG
jgi:hypothetical protein